MTENDNILIDMYLNGKLTDDEKKLFEIRLSKDEFLRRDLNLIKDIQFAVTSESDTLRKKVKVIFNQKSFSYKKGSLIAALSIIGIIFYFSIKHLTKHNPDILYAEYFEAYPDNITNRNETKTNTLSILLQNYNSGHFNEIVLKDYYKNSKAQSDTFNFFLANALMVKEDFTEAINIFNNSISENSIYYTQSKWYLALSYLKIGNIDLAKKLFKEISKTSQDKIYVQKSKQILANL